MSISDKFMTEIFWCRLSKKRLIINDKFRSLTKTYSLICHKSVHPFQNQWRSSLVRAQTTGFADFCQLCFSFFKVVIVVATNFWSFPQKFVTTFPFIKRTLWWKPCRLTIHQETHRKSKWINNKNRNIFNWGHWHINRKTAWLGRLLY